MNPDPNDPLVRVRADLERLHAALVNKDHWVFITDDPGAADVLRNSAGNDAIHFKAIGCRTDRIEVYPFVILAVRKKAWPPSAVLRVASAAARRRLPHEVEDAVKAGQIVFPISPHPMRLIDVLERILDGTFRLGPMVG